MAILSHNEILRIHDAVVSAGIASECRTLLAGLPRDYVATMDAKATHTVQALADLHKLNEDEQLADGTVPLDVWLANAAAVAGPRAGSSVFADARTRVLEKVRERSSHVDSPTPSAIGPAKRVPARPAPKIWPRVIAGILVVGVLTASFILVRMLTPTDRAAVPPPGAPDPPASVTVMAPSTPASSVTSVTNNPRGPASAAPLGGTLRTSATTTTRDKSVDWSDTDQDAGPRRPTPR